MILVKQMQVKEQLQKKYVAYSTQRYTYAAVQASLLKSAYMLNLNQHLNPDENSGPTFTKKWYQSASHWRKNAHG